MGELKMEKSSMEKINQFREDRDWKQYHNEKDLAISISLEASELLELFQWKSPEEVRTAKRERIEEELADVLIYSYMLADNLEMNIDDIITRKLEKNNQKYPIEKSFGRSDKYDEL